VRIRLPRLQDGGVARPASTGHADTHPNRKKLIIRTWCEGNMQPAWAIRAKSTTGKPGSLLILARVGGPLGPESVCCRWPSGC